MEKIEQMSVQNKIYVIEYVRKNYSALKRCWTTEKVIWLEELINAELMDIGDFELPSN